MPPHRTLVFPACNEPGLEIVRSLLKSSKFQVCGASSIDPRHDPSRALLDDHVTLPALGDRGFREAVERCLIDRQIEIVFPAVDSLVVEFSRWAVAGTRFVTPRPEIACIVASKSRTYAALTEIVPVPTVYGDDRPPLPAYAKPDSGAGSRGHLLISNEDEYRLARRRGLLITEFLPGAEHTVDCISDCSGRLLSANVRVRADVQRGISVSGGSAPSTEIEQHVVRISQALAIEGPWFAQFKQAADGTHRLLEINARVAGSMGTTRLTGVNIPQLAAFIFLGYPVVVPEPLADVFVNRCLSTVGSVDDFDWAIWDLEDTLLRKDRKPDPDAIACLFDLQNRGKRQVLLTRHPNPRALLADYRLPDLFVRIATTSDKIASFSELAREFAIEPRRCVAINDSNTEKLQFQRAFPELRVVTPDAIDVLGRERVS